MNKISDLNKLIEHFKFYLKQYKNSGHDVVNIRVDFINKFFKLLDLEILEKNIKKI